MNIQFRESSEAASPLAVKTAIADCDIHPARATRDRALSLSRQALARIISKPTAPMPIRA